MASAMSPFFVGQKKSLNLLQADLTILTIINQNLRTYLANNRAKPKIILRDFIQKKIPSLRLSGEGI